SREEFVRECLAEHLIVGAEVVDLQTALGDPGSSTGFEGIYGFVGKPLWEPPAHGSSAQPFVFEWWELAEIVKGMDLLARIPTEGRSEIEPERAARGRIEMPLDHLAYVSIELGLCFPRSQGQFIWSNNHLLSLLCCLSFTKRFIN